MSLLYAYAVVVFAYFTLVWYEFYVDLHRFYRVVHKSKLSKLTNSIVKWVAYCEADIHEIGLRRVSVELHRTKFRPNVKRPCHIPKVTANKLPNYLFRGSTIVVSTSVLRGSKSTKINSGRRFARTLRGSSPRPLSCWGRGQGRGLAASPRTLPPLRPFRPRSLSPNPEHRSTTLPKIANFGYLILI